MRRSVKRPIQESDGAVESALGRGSGMPLYQQIVALLTNRIRSGAILPGEYLPGENGLCAEYGVSRITAKRAMNELAQAGLVARERGKGTLVLANRLAPVFSASIDGWRENVSMMGRSTSVRVLEFSYVPASGEVASALEIEKCDTVQRAVRVRSLSGEPFSYLVTYVPEDIGRCYRRKDLGNNPLHTLLERGGVNIAAAHQTLTATLADTPVAGILNIPVGSPLIEVERVVRDDGGRPVQFIRILYRPDLYRFELYLGSCQNRSA